MQSNRQAQHKPRRRAAVGHDAFARVIALMARKTACAQEVADESGLHVVTVRKLLRTMVLRNAAHPHGKKADSMGRLSVTTFRLGPKKERRA